MTAVSDGKSALVSAIATSEVTATFAGGKVTGRAGVNSYGAAYTATGADMTVRDVVATKMAGPPELMAQESAFLSALQRSANYSIEADTLTLRDRSGSTTLEFNAE